MNKKILSVLVLVSILTSSCSIFGYQVTRESTPQATAAQQISSKTPAPTKQVDIDPNLLGGLQGMEQALTAIYGSVEPSVVHIQVEKVEQISTTPFQLPDLFPFINPFDQQEQQPQERKVVGQGSGFVWDSAGNIVTNNHVVEDADKIIVTFYDGISIPAELVGNDIDADLAVIKVDPDETELAPITLGDSTQVQVGDLSIAIGNPYGLQGTMTLGIISALGRSLPVNYDNTNGSQYTIPDVIQTDASINPGNSGGVLVNIQGQVIGVTTAIQSSTGGNVGIGFVIPSVIANNVVPQLIETGEYQHTYIGISGQTLNSQLAQEMELSKSQRGVLVMDVQPDSPAEKAGLQGSDRTVTVEDVEVRIGGDVITAINSQPVNDFEDLVAYLARYTSVGQQITLDILRDGKSSSLELTLSARPAQDEDESAQAESTKEQVWLGIFGINMTSEIASAMGLDKDQSGVLVQQVEKGSPGDKAGLRGSYMPADIDGQQVLVGGDVITALEGHNIRTLDDLQQILSNFTAGDTIVLEILRDGEPLSINVTLEVK